MRGPHACLVSVALILTVTLLVSPLPKVLAQAGTGTLAGKATDGVGGVLPPNTTVNLVDASGNVVRSVPVGADGSFSFSGLNPANYSIQLVSPAGTVFGASSAVAVTAGTTTTVAVTATSVTAATVAGVVGFPLALVVSVVGIGAGIVVVSVVKNDDSPSR